MVLNEDQGAYNTSEVAQSLLEILEAQACLCVDEDGKVPEDEIPVEADMYKNKDGDLVVELEPKSAGVDEQIAAEFATGEARRQLERLAYEAVKAGHVKAAYIIERALHKIDSNDPK